MNWRERWQAFTNHIAGRLEMGELRYGHAGFEYEPHRLVHEAREEIWDAVAYLFMLHERLDHIERKVGCAGDCKCGRGEHER